MDEKLVPLPKEDSSKQCNWNDELPCQFANNSNAVTEYRGRSYCNYHLPADAEGALDFDSASTLIKTERNLQGIYLPKGKYRFPDVKGEVTLRYCAIAADVQLVLSGRSKYKFDHCTCLGRLFVSSDAEVNASWNKAKIKGRLLLLGAPFVAKSWSFKGARFESGANFSKVKFLLSLNLKDALFEGTVEFDETLFPQRIVIDGLKMGGKAIAGTSEGSFRAARLQFSTQKNRDVEGRFYMWEKRCFRKSLSLKKIRNWFPWITANIYDWTSLYGHSFERAFLIFTVLQLGFGFGYARASGRLGIGPLDTSVVTFTLAQVAKPFELLAAKEPTSKAFVDVLGSSNVYSGWWIGFTVLHSVLSLAVVALFLLALNWRFRRE
jgi:hypothetical protein